MTSSSSTNYADLVRTTQAGQKVQEAVANLASCIQNAKSEGNEQAMNTVREEFKEEFRETVGIVRTMFQRPGTKYYLSRATPLLVLQGGWSNLNNLVTNDDCLVLIPFPLSNPVGATIEVTNGKRETFTFQTNSEYIIAGKCSIWLPEGSKVTCVALGIKREKG